MKKNIFSVLTLIILFTFCTISGATSSVKIISSGEENNVFEAKGALRFEWTDEDDCDAIDGNSVKQFFIPDNPKDFGEWVFVYYYEVYPEFLYGYVRKSELKKNIRHPFENIDLFY